MEYSALLLQLGWSCHRSGIRSSRHVICFSAPLTRYSPVKQRFGRSEVPSVLDCTAMTGRERACREIPSTTMLEASYRKTLHTALPKKRSAARC